MGCKCNFITKSTLEVQSECENLIAWGKKPNNYYPNKTTIKIT